MSGVVMPSLSEPTDEPAEKARPGADLALKLAGAVVVTGLGGVFGLFEAFLSPLRIPGSTYLPISLVLAVVGNPALAWWAGQVTGRRLAALLPAAAWCVVWFLAATKTAEGDLLITGGNWVGLITLLAGPISFALGVYVPVIREQNRAMKERALRDKPPAR
jgi:hypothetical protein